MRKTHIALLVAVVSSPLALADSYDPYHSDSDPYNSYQDSSYDYKDVETNITKNKTITVKDSFNEDNDYLAIKDSNNKYLSKYIDNSVYENTDNTTYKIESNYYTATSTLDGMVTYSEVNYGACCNKGRGHYGDAVQSTLHVTHTNSMQDAFTGASGINIAGQNAGNNSLVQQSASTNAMLTGQ